ncbi:MAG TPA: redoxin family protein [Candidatus Krumholzibacteria bacterium]|nr:redoxin family protein [Candidatus Krumholzibacteria bacterium]
MRIVITVLSLLVLVAGISAAAPEERALCAVCVLNGESEPEKVVASRAYNGVTQHFCSEKCAGAFDLDPAAYVFAPGPAPKAAFVSLSGDSLEIGAAGRVTLVDFWATWCKPCVKSMPALDALHREFRERGADVVGVAIDTGRDRAKKVRKFAEKNGAGYPIALDREEAPMWEAYRVKVLPTVFLIDRDGTIVKRWTGEVDVEDVRSSLEALLREGEPVE